MAYIKIFDATDLDRQQLTQALEPTDHHWEFSATKLSMDQLNPDIEVLSVFVTSDVTAEVINALPKLRVIACRSTGCNNIDLAAAKKRDIAVLNVPTYGESTVAEYAFLLLMALMRKLPDTLRGNNQEFASAELRGNDLHGKTLGVIGTGHIGLNSIRIANGFGMKVVAYDAYPKNDMQAANNFTYKSLKEVAAEADVLSLHAPLTPSTKHLVDANLLKNMKPTAVLINTARGELIDNRALVDALNDHQIAGAGLDVIEGESLLNQHEEIALLRRDDIDESLLRHSIEISTLQKMPNVLITPHNAFNTEEAIGRINSTTAQNIIDYWYGNMPNRIVVPESVDGHLIVVRHTESLWNATGQWTGRRDVHLSEKGYHEAALLGLKLRRQQINVDQAYCSEQVRTFETLQGILAAAHQIDIPIKKSGALNERDYGDYTGKNKWQMREIIGEDRWNEVRRGWDVPVPNGETLKDVYSRVVPFYNDTLLPDLKAGKNVLLVAHGNSIRALMKHIENIPNEEVPNTEMLFGEFVDYTLNTDGSFKDKSIIKIDMTPPNA